MNYCFNPAARTELLEQIAYYEARQAGLGSRFLTAFTGATDRVCEAPARHRIEVPPDIRRHRVPGFRFSILYRQRDSLTVEVLVIVSHRRKPGYWLERLRRSDDTEAGPKAS